MKDSKKVAALLKELKSQMTTEKEITIIKECEKQLNENFIEEWRDVEGYDGRYQVSNMGRVRGIKILKATPNQEGYLTVSFSKNDVSKTYRVHVLVAKAFIPNPENKPVVNLDTPHG